MNRSTSATTTPEGGPRLTRSAGKATMVAFVGLALAGTLAGCASAADASGTATGSTTDTTTTAPTAAATTGGSDAAASGATYKDGTYTAKGSYQSPGGDEGLTVTLTLAKDVVTKVDVVSGAVSPNGKQYQAQFISGIQAEVVGKDIDQLKVSKVAGSSLTSGGFNEAVDEIKADAQAK